jgi:hypothetical protein
MLLRCVLSAVCVVLLAPVVPARARASDDPSSRVTLHGTSATLPDPTSVQGLGAETLTRSEPRITVEPSGVSTVQSPEDGNSQGPPVVVLHVPKITCPMVMVAADPEIDPKFVTQPPKDTTFTIRSVAPTACR